MPTAAQHDAGNYKLAGRKNWNGLQISIETRKGQRRRPEWPKMPAHYGYIRGTMARDGDHVDVFIGPNLKSDLVVVVDQVTQGGRFDEHKVLIGFDNKADAVATYRRAYTRGWKVGPVTTMTVDQFRTWLKRGNTKRRIRPQVSRYGTPPLQSVAGTLQDVENIFHAAVAWYGAAAKLDENRYGAAQAGLWNEEDHPRDEDGKFAPVPSAIHKYPKVIPHPFDPAGSDRVADRPPVYLTGSVNKKIREAAKTTRNIGVLVTPDTKQYAKLLDEFELFGVDNGGFSGTFKEGKFYTMLRQIRRDGHADKALFVVAPDSFDRATMKGDWDKTLKKSAPHLKRIRAEGFPAAIVLQDGATPETVPWDDVDALFVGGSNAFKLGHTYEDKNKINHGPGSIFPVLKEAEKRNVPVHFGRVNSDERLENTGWGMKGMSADGTHAAFVSPEEGTDEILQWLEKHGTFPKKGPTPEYDRQTMRRGKPQAFDPNSEPDDVGDIDDDMELFGTLDAEIDYYAQLMLWNEDEHPRDDVGKFTSKLRPAVKSAGELKQGGAKRRGKQGLFDKPIKGPSGVQLHGYEWKHEKYESVDEKGDEKIELVSSWDEAETNEHTNRKIVHLFEVEHPSGKGGFVSLETAIQLMGYAEGSADAKRIRGLGEALIQLHNKEREIDRDGAGWSKDKTSREKAKRDDLKKKVSALMKAAEKGSTPTEAGTELLKRIDDTIRKMHVTPRNNRLGFGAVRQHFKTAADIDTAHRIMRKLYAATRRSAFGTHNSKTLTAHKATSRQAANVWKQSAELHDDIDTIETMLDEQKDADKFNALSFADAVDYYARIKPSPGQLSLWDEDEHPRKPSGSSEGGRFTTAGKQTMPDNRSEIKTTKTTWKNPAKDRPEPINRARTFPGGKAKLIESSGSPTPDAVGQDVYYLTSGRKGARYTLRHRFVESVGDDELRLRDHHLDTFGKDYDKAVDIAREVLGKGKTLYGGKFELNKDREAYDGDQFKGGKHEGETIEHVAKTDPRYIQILWLSERLDTEHPQKGKFAQKVVAAGHGPIPEVQAHILATAELSEFDKENQVAEVVDAYPQFQDVANESEGAINWDDFPGGDQYAKTKAGKVSKRDVNSWDKGLDWFRDRLDDAKRSEHGHVGSHGGQDYYVSEMERWQGIADYKGAGDGNAFWHAVKHHAAKLEKAAREKYLGPDSYTGKRNALKEKVDSTEQAAWDKFKAAYTAPAEQFAAAADWFSVDQYAHKKTVGQGQGEFKWVTIGSDSSQPAGSKGGTPVAIDGQGNIAAGPDKLVGDNVDHIGGEKEAPEYKPGQKFAEAVEKFKQRDKDKREKRRQLEKSPDPSDEEKAAVAAIDKENEAYREERKARGEPDSYMDDYWERRKEAQSDYLAKKREYYDKLAAAEVDDYKTRADDLKGKKAHEMTANDWIIQNRLKEKEQHSKDLNKWGPLLQRYRDAKGKQPRDWGEIDNVIKEAESSRGYKALKKRYRKWDGKEGGFYDILEGILGDKGLKTSEPVGWDTINDWQAKEAHAELIAKALKAGKDIPNKVLKEARYSSKLELTEEHEKQIQIGDSIDTANEYKKSDKARLQAREGRRLRDLSNEKQDANRLSILEQHQRVADYTKEKSQKAWKTYYDAKQSIDADIAKDAEQGDHPLFGAKTLMDHYRARWLKTNQADEDKESYATYSEARKTYEDLVAKEAKNNPKYKERREEVANLYKKVDEARDDERNSRAGISALVMQDVTGRKHDDGLEPVKWEFIGEHKPDAEQMKKYDTARTWLNKWMPAHMAGTYKIKFNPERGRASGGDFMNVYENSDTTTIVHELGHLIDHGNADNKHAYGKSAVAFLNAEVQSAPVEHLGDSYGNTEIATKNGFSDAYTGKDYHQVIGGASSEVFSMGLQHIWEGDLDFLKAKNHANFILSTLAGDHERE